MPVTVIVIVKNERTKLALEPGSTARDAITAAPLHPSGTLVIRNGTPIPEDSLLQNGDELKLIPVASGG